MGHPNEFSSISPFLVANSDRGMENVFDESAEPPRGNEFQDSTTNLFKRARQSRWIVLTIMDF